ncbi:MAG: hypothetical protein ACLFWG_00370 [Longimicrobiales bacterium]
MARVSVAEVKLVIDTSLKTEQVSALIGDANTWVNENLGGYTSLSANLLKTIEKYLAAHLITLRDPRLTRAQLDDVAETYQRDPRVSEYLRTAASLDPTGTIEAKLVSGGAPKATFRVSEGYDDTLDLPGSSS